MTVEPCNTTNNTRMPHSSGASHPVAQKDLAGPAAAALPPSELLAVGAGHPPAPLVVAALLPLELAGPGVAALLLSEVLAVGILEGKDSQVMIRSYQMQGKKC